MCWHDELTVVLPLAEKGLGPGAVRAGLLLHGHHRERLLRPPVHRRQPCPGKSCSVFASQTRGQRCHTQGLYKYFHRPWPHLAWRGHEDLRASLLLADHWIGVAEAGAGGTQRLLANPRKREATQGLDPESCPAPCFLRELICPSSSQSLKWRPCRPRHLGWKPALGISRRRVFIVLCFIHKHKARKAYGIL